MWIEIIVSLLGTIALVVFIVWKSYLKQKMIKIEVSPNMPIIENDYRTEFTEGYSLGVVKSQIPNKNGTFRIEYYPIDVEQGEGIPRPIMQSVIVGKDLIKRFARGRLSSYRERIKLIDRDSSKIPEELKDTTEGKWMTKEGQLAYLKSTFGRMIPSGDEALAEAMKEYARGQVTKSVLASIREENAQFRKLREMESNSEPSKKD